jgi:protein SCO1/2
VKTLRSPSGIVKTLLLITLVISWGALALSGCSPAVPVIATSGSDGVEIAAEADSPQEFGPVPAFSLVDQLGRTVTREDLAGRPWVMAAIFSRCTGPCPAISKRMAELQRQLNDTDVVLVSISVDPDHDSADVLSSYAASWEADPERWLFLTGDQGSVHSLVRDGFWMAVDRLEGETIEAGLAVTHDTRLVAVDAMGIRRGWYNQDEPAHVGRLLARMRYLASEEGR